MFLLLRLVRRAVSVVVLCAVTAVVWTAIWVLGNSFREDLTRTDAIVVMGAAQFDGDPSPVLRNRLDRAFDLYSQRVAPFVITVGGSQPGDRFTEATSGRRYLESRGIRTAHIAAVRTGSNTYESARAVARVAQKRGWTRLTIVTDRMHAARASAMMSSFGFTVHPAPPASGPGSSLTWSYLVHETGGLLQFWLVTVRSPA